MILGTRSGSVKPRMVHVRSVWVHEGTQIRTGWAFPGNG